MPDALAEDLASDASAISRGNWEHASRASAEPETPWNEQDIETTKENVAANGSSSLEPKKDLALSANNRWVLPLYSSPIGEVPMPHTNAWQTVPLAEAAKGGSEVNIQGTSQPSGAKVAPAPAESSPGPISGEGAVQAAAETDLSKDSEDALTAYSSDPYELLPHWLREMRQKSEKTALSGNELLLENQDAGRGLIAAAGSTKVVEEPKNDLVESKTTEAATDREPVAGQSESPGSSLEAAYGETVDGANTGVAGTAAVSPAVESASAVTADIRKEAAPEEVNVVKVPELEKPTPPQPRETDLASGGKPEEVLAGGSAGHGQNLADEKKELDPKPAVTSARFASLETDNEMRSPAEERRRPTGYITVESKPESSQNLGPADHLAKPQDHPGFVQDHSQKTQNRRLAVQEYPSKAQDHPRKTSADSPKAEEKSGDLQRFALAFLRSDQSGNVADQHRFYADSVHFYREGDLSWAGVEAATRRYHQERQNKRYGTEGTAAVKGPVDGGFYIVEQPVSWSRAEGSRQIRGKSVLRLRVVPTSRGDWRITSIDEIGQ
jgi:hypothetical protein